MRGPVEFAWDARKAEVNLRKHGIPLDLAIAVFADRNHVVIEASGTEDAEDRQKVIGLIQGRVFTAVFVERGSVCRLISARRANRKEEGAYGNIET